MNWLHAAEAAVASPWLYVVLFAISLVDSFLPAIPSEPVLVMAGVAASTGETSLLLVIAATAAGAFVGDTVPYIVGRVLTVPILARLPVGTRRRRIYDRASTELAAHAGSVLITSRFIPVGRYFVTLSAGISKLRWRIFGLYTGIAVVAWSVYVILAGYLGGAAAQENPLVAIGVGLLMATLISAVIRIAVRLNARRRNAPGAQEKDRGRLCVP